MYKDGEFVQDPKKLKIDNDNVSKYGIWINDKKEEVYVSRTRPRL